MCRNQVFLLIFRNNSRPKQNKKNPEHYFVEIAKKETIKKKYLQKIFNSMVVRARQNFQFFKQNTWFLESSRALSKFLYRISLCFISIIKKKKSDH